jgi:hypothetical protein
MTTYNDYAQLAADNNLKCGHVTGGSNGYPTPYLGAFIHGFDTYEQAENFVVNKGGRMVLCKQKNGWDVWEKHSNRVSPLCASDYLDDLGDDVEIVDSEYLFSQLNELQESRLDNDLVAAELRMLAKHFETLYKCEGNNKTFYLYNGTCDTIDNEMMSYHEDVTTWTVGVLFEKQD